MSATDRDDTATSELPQLGDPASFESWTGDNDSAVPGREMSAAPQPVEDPATMAIPVVAAQPEPRLEPRPEPRPEPHPTAEGPSPAEPVVPPVMTPVPVPVGLPESAAAQVPRPVAHPAPAGPRRVRLVVSRVDPWSIMKMSFLLSVAIAIASVVTAAGLWTILSGLGIFSKIDQLIKENQLAGSSPINILDYVGLGRVVSLSIVISVINVILLTAISTLGAFLYNIASALVGGIQVTLTDD